MPAQRLTPDSTPSHFGAFYPLGYLAVAFRHKGDAAQVREALVTSGYDADDAQIIPAASVELLARRSLEATSPMCESSAGRRGPRSTSSCKEGVHVHAHLRPVRPRHRACHGGGAQAFRYGLAHKFDRFAVHELSSDDRLASRERRG